MQLVKLEQGTSDWHDFRKKGVGSSDITILLGSYPFGKKTPLSLFEEKTSGLFDNDDSSAMAYGRGQEKNALEYLRQKDPSLKSACAVHEDYGFIRCSFDALGSDTFYEIKSPYSLEVLEKALMGELQQYWIDQTRWQLLISGFQVGYVAVWDGNKAHTFEIKKDLEWENNAIQIAQDFWDRVITGQRPDPTTDDYLEVEDPECAALLQEYYKLGEQEKELKQCKDFVKSKILDKGPGHNFMVDGIKVYQMQNTSYDFSKMKADGINLTPYKKVSHPYWMIAPKRGASKSR